MLNQVIFDFDGTLFSTGEAIQHSRAVLVNRLVSETRLRQELLERRYTSEIQFLYNLQHKSGLTLEALYSSLLGVWRSTAINLITDKYKLLENLPLFPKINFYIASNSCVEIIDFILNKFELRSYFKEIHGYTLETVSTYIKGEHLVKLLDGKGDTVLITDDKEDLQHITSHDQCIYIGKESIDLSHGAVIARKDYSQILKILNSMLWEN